LAPDGPDEEKCAVPGLIALPMEVDEIVAKECANSLFRASRIGPIRMSVTIQDALKRQRG
jgi:hypothetical protein